MGCCKKKFFTLLILPVSFFCRAQKSLTDSTHHLKEVEVTANRLQHFASGNKIENIDSSALQDHSSNTLADLLASESQVFIRSYGITGLATPSFRGSGASHAAVLWNGFNLSSPMSGQLDFALVPVNFLDNVKLQLGGSGALWGSGAVGGTIHLGNVPEFDKGFSPGATLSYGSFEDQQQNFEISFSEKRLISSTRLFNHEAKNNFSFINIAQLGKPEQRLANAELKQYGLLQENYFKINEKQKISLRLWYQSNDRNIPASMTISKSLANQKDEFYRSTAEWQLTKEKTAVFVRSAYFDESLSYVDPLINLESISHSRSFITEAESKIRVSSNQSFNIGLNNTWSEAVTKNYIKNPQQNRTALFASYRINNKRDTWRGAASVRQEFISNGSNPFTASAGIEGWLLKKIRLRGNVSKNYRLPTFNDLYWTGAGAFGNPNLIAENGWSQEAGLAFIRCVNNCSIEAEITGFSNKVDNWIMWVPDNLGLWSPENVLSVWSRGLEYDLKTRYNAGKVKLHLDARYQFIVSRNEKTNPGSGASLQKQLIYAPAEKAQGNTGAAYKGFRLSFSYNYVGYRYTTSDNTQYLKPYHYGNIDLGKEFRLTNMKIRVFMQVNNIWNESYQIIAYYPMPGRYYQMGITISYNHPNNK